MLRKRHASERRTVESRATRDKFKPILLANVGKPGSHTLAAYRPTGGYAGLSKVLAEMTPGKSSNMVKPAICAAAAEPAFRPA